jgi:hypothetical protein
MTLYRFSNIGEHPRGPHLDEVRKRLDLVFPGLRWVARDFEVPGRGRQEAVAVGPERECVLVECAGAGLPDVLTRLLDRLAWFEENRTLLPRLFPERPLDPDRPIQAILLAPSVESSLVRAVSRLSLTVPVHLLRLRLIQSETATGFLVEHPDRVDRPLPFATPRSGSQEDGPAATTPRHTVPSFRPLRAVSPEELLSRSRHWLTRLSPDLEIETTGDRTRFLFASDLLATMTVCEDHLEIEVPGPGPTIRARDGHELNRGMNPVIQRYFSLVAPQPANRHWLTKEDILTDEELAAFLDDVDPA